MKRGFTVRLLSYTALGFSWVYLINCVSAVFSSSSGDWMGDLRSPDPASHPIVLTRLFSGYVRRLALRATIAGNLPSLLGQELFLKAIQAWKIDHSVICQLLCLWDKNLFTWFWWSAVEWHCGAIFLLLSFYSLLHSNSIQCVTVFAQTTIYPGKLCFRV